jgi:hypothetical protein
MPPRELNMTIGKLPPVFDDRHIARLRTLIEYFAGLQARRVNRQGEYFRFLNAGHPVGQITGASEHETSSAQCTAYPARWTSKLKGERSRRAQLSPLITVRLQCEIRPTVRAFCRRAWLLDGTMHAQSIGHRQFGQALNAGDG